MKKMSIKRPETLQNRLFRSFFLIVSLVLILCFLLLGYFFANNEYRRMHEHLGTIAASAANAIDSEITIMSNASMNSIYSKPLKTDMDTLDPVNPDWNLILRINSIIGSIIGPNSTVSQINIYSVNNYMVGWGSFSINRPLIINAQPWFNYVNELNGSKFISIPSINQDFVSINPYMKNQYYLSMYRMYFDSAFQPQGIIEVVQSCDTFFSHIQKLQKENPELSIIISNIHGDILYPFDSEKTDTTNQRLLASIPIERANTFRDAENNLIFFNQELSNNTDWNITVIQSATYLTRKIYPLLLSFTALLLTFLGVSFYLCFYVAKSLLYPLNSLKTQLEKTNINEILNSDTSLLINYEENTPKEIGSLLQIYNNMYLSLKDTSKTIITAKAEETRAKLFATQSMLNPHFLYNNLTNISIMAENQMSPQIISFCKNLSSYLRYISSGNLANVDIAAEVRYSINYLECMKTRYEDKLYYDFIIPELLEKIAIPKLSLQPLIENSLKYAFHDSPPWAIRISAEQVDGFCLLSVTDNGVGFTEDSLAALKKQLQDIRNCQDIYSLEIGGLGIKNVLLRLLFMYGDKADIIPSIAYNKGAKITIKIPLSKGGMTDE